MIRVIAIKPVAVSKIIIIPDLITSNCSQVVLLPLFIEIKLRPEVLIDCITVSQVQDASQGNGPGECAICIYLGQVVDLVPGLICSNTIKVALVDHRPAILVKQLCTQGSYNAIFDIYIDPV